MPTAGVLTQGLSSLNEIRQRGDRKSPHLILESKRLCQAEGVNADQLQRVQCAAQSPNIPPPSMNNSWSLRSPQWSALAYKFLVCVCGCISVQFNRSTICHQNEKPHNIVIPL